MSYKNEELYRLLQESKYPRDIKYREFERFLISLGFEKRKGKGSHVVFSHANYKDLKITLSSHGQGMDVKATYVREVSKKIKEYELTL